MKKIARVLLALTLVLPVWPQSTATNASQGTQSQQTQATKGSCAAGYYRNSAGVCVHRPVKTTQEDHSAGTFLATTVLYTNSSREPTAGLYQGNASWISVPCRAITQTTKAKAATVIWVLAATVLVSFV